MYRQIDSNTIQRIGDFTCFPCDPENPDYQEALAWVALGNSFVQAAPPNPNLAIQAQIDTIERTTMVPRVMREFLLASAELEAKRQADAHGVAAADLLAANPGYVKTKQIDIQIKQLRSQLT